MQEQQAERAVTTPAHGKDLYDGLQFTSAGYNEQVFTLRATGRRGAMTGEWLWAVVAAAVVTTDYTESNVLEFFAKGRWKKVPATQALDGQWFRAAAARFIEVERRIACGEWAPVAPPAVEPVGDPNVPPGPGCWSRRNGQWVPEEGAEAAAGKHSVGPHTDEDAIELARLLGEPKEPPIPLLSAACNEIVKLRALAQFRYDEMMKIAAARDQLYTERTQLADRCGELRSALKDKRAECDELRDRLRKLDRSPTPERR